MIEPVTRSRRLRGHWIALSLIALFAHLALPGAHLLQRAHAMQGAYELGLCGASPALIARLRAQPNAAPVSREGLPHGPEDRGCQDPSVFVGPLVVETRPASPDWSAWRHEYSVFPTDAATRDAATLLPRARGPPHPLDPNSRPIRA
jgi:hypothetical protein